MYSALLIYNCCFSYTLRSKVLLVALNCRIRCNFSFFFFSREKEKGRVKNKHMHLTYNNKFCDMNQKYPGFFLHISLSENSVLFRYTDSFDLQSQIQFLAIRKQKLSRYRDLEESGLSHTATVLSKVWLSDDIFLGSAPLRCDWQ